MNILSPTKKQPPQNEMIAIDSGLIITYS